MTVLAVFPNSVHLPSNQPDEKHIPYRRFLQHVLLHVYLLTGRKGCLVLNDISKVFPGKLARPFSFN
jgi:hypothetical protein